MIVPNNKSNNDQKRGRQSRYYSKNKRHLVNLMALFWEEEGVCEFIHLIAFVYFDSNDDDGVRDWDWWWFFYLFMIDRFIQSWSGLITIIIILSDLCGNVMK